MVVSLISGGCGFIGSHLVDFLLSIGHHVIVMDNMACSSETNIVQLHLNPKFKFIKVDVCNQDCFKILEEVDQIDYIFHLASYASPKHYMMHPIETLTVGSIGTQNMLELARKYNAKFLLASTSEVYGDPLIHPQTEDYWGNVNPVGPRSCYDESKRYAEALVIAYKKIHGTWARIARIFNTFGPRMSIDDGRVIPTFVRQALEGNPLPIYGSGVQTRSFIFVRDIVEGLWKLINSEANTPVNLGNPYAEFSIKQIAEKVIELTNSASKIEYHPPMPDDPQMRKPDISLAKELLNWEPTVSILDGLKLTIQYFQA